MSAFNTEHIPVREIDAGGPNFEYSQWTRYHVVFACGRTAFRGQTSLYAPAKNRKMCRKCKEEHAAAGSVPLGPPRMTRHTAVGEKDATGPRWKNYTDVKTVTVFACGMEAPAHMLESMTGERENQRPCPGCEAALNPRGEDPAYRKTDSARLIYRAIKTATGDPRLPGLAYAFTGGLSGFHRQHRQDGQDGRNCASAGRIMEEASNLMEMAVRACPRILWRRLRIQGRLAGPETRPRGEAPPDAPEGEMEKLFAQAEETLAEFGFSLEEQEDGARRLTEAGRRNRG